MEIKLESPKQLADRIGWPVSRIRKLIRREELRHFRMGKSIMIPPDAITEYMQRIEVQPEIGELKTSNQCS